MPPEETHIYRNIAVGETFRHKGEVILHGRINRGSILDITRGGITILGKVEANVTVNSDGPVRLDDDAAGGLRIRSRDSVTLGHTGDNLNVTAGGSVFAGNIGRKANIRCAGSLTAGELGHGSIIACDGGIQFTRVGHDCRITSGDFTNVSALGANSTVAAGTSALVGLAHRFAQAKGRTQTIIRRTGEEPGAFKIAADAAKIPCPRRFE